MAPADVVNLLIPLVLAVGIWWGVRALRSAAARRRLRGPHSIDLVGEPIVAGDDRMVLVDAVVEVAVVDVGRAVRAEGDYRTGMESVARAALRDEGYRAPSTALLADGARMRTAARAACRRVADQWGVAVEDVQVTVRPWDDEEARQRFGG